MSTSRAKTTGQRRKPRVTKAKARAKAPAPAKVSPKAAPRRKKRAAAKPKASQAGKSRKQTLQARRKRQAALPGWNDQTDQNLKALGRPEGRGFLEQVSTVRFLAIILLVAAGFTLYVGHVHATQELLSELQQVRRQNLSLHLKDHRVKGAFDRATGPRVINQRAAALGLMAGQQYGPTITIE